MNTKTHYSNGEDLRPTRRVIVRPLDESRLVTFYYHAFIGVVGYENRASFVAKRVAVRAKLRLACAFDTSKVFEYENNCQWFSDNGFVIEEKTDVEFRTWCEEKLRALLIETDEPLRLCIDISSMSRLRIATLIAALFEMEGPPIEADFLYAPAKYTPPTDSEGPIIASGPVVDTFAGWTTEPESPPATVFGLGYERDKAVGAMEYIEPSEIWAFRPNGEDKKYDKEVKRANKAFLEILPTNHLMPYRVARPYECFRDLESLVFGTLRSARPVLIPFGPKIFSICCLLTACVHHPSVSVWRISSGQFAPPIDRIADGSIVGIKCHFRSPGT